MASRYTRYRKAKKVTLITAGINFILAMGKLFFGAWGGSQALVADGVNSLSDVAVDGMVIFATKASNQAPDRSHPYGHGRIETVFTLGLAIILITVGLGIGYDVFYHLITHTKVCDPQWSTVIVAIVSILANEFIFRFNLFVGKQIHSGLLKANAWHHRSDALSSIVVLIGILGAKWGIHYMDGIAAIFVALMILRVAVKMMWINIRELIDTGVDANLQKEIEQTIRSTSGVRAVHLLRSRTIAGAILLDVHVEVAPSITVSEGHFISSEVSKNLEKRFSQIADVVVHVDVENDDFQALPIVLPNRQTLLKQLREIWLHLPGFDQIENINLHYRHNRIDVELIFPLIYFKSLDQQQEAELVSQYQQSVTQLRCIGQVKFFGELSR